MGPVSLSVLADIGVHDIAELKKRGWEAVAFELAQKHPRFINMNMYRALIGATLDCDWREIPENELARAMDLLGQLKN